MNNFVFNCVFNNLSFGQVSIAICREIYSRSLFPYISTIGGSPIDLRGQKPLKMFEAWANSCYGNYITKYQKTKDSKCLRLWHFNQSKEAVLAEKNYLLTFHELDQLTPAEVSTALSYDKVLVTSNYSKKVFEDFGIKNVNYIDLGFDKDNFWKLNKRPYTDDRIVFGLFGKLEHRKHHIKILKAWGEKYGNNPQYTLHAAIFNPFLSPEDQTKIIIAGMGGKKYWNINFLPQVQSNVDYNEMVNSVDIVLALSGGEGRGLPEFHAVGLGKHCVGLRAHAYLDYLNDQNAVLIDHNGKIPVYDNIHFHQGQPFNQGNIWDFKSDDMIAACEVAINKYKTNPLNVAGLELQKRTYKDTVDQIFSVMEF